jgi:hypothetical protein
VTLGVLVEPVAVVELDLNALGRRLTPAGRVRVGETFQFFRASGWFGAGRVRARVLERHAWALRAALDGIAADPTATTPSEGESLCR